MRVESSLTIFPNKLLLAGNSQARYDQTQPFIEENQVTTPTRREKFEAMLATDPQDQFLRYALAMEYEKEGEHERSLEFLRGLMADDPPHVPSFFMAGQHLTKQDRIAEARDVLRAGIEQARQQGNAHAAGEMSEFLAGLGSLGE